MIPKNDFVSAVNSIKEVEEFYHQYGHKCYVKNALIRTLMDAVGDKYEWTAWYVNTTKYGTVNNAVSAGVSKNTTKHYLIDSVDALYDFLVDYYSEHDSEIYQG